MKNKHDLNIFRLIKFERNRMLVSVCTLLGHRSGPGQVIQIDTIIYWALWIEVNQVYVINRIKKIKSMTSSSKKKKIITSTKDVFGNICRSVGKNLIGISGVLD